MHIADIIIEAYAMESAWLRSQKLAALGRVPAAEFTAVLLRDAMARIEISARNVLAAAPISGWMPRLRTLTAYEPVDAIEIRRRIAQRLLQAERYVI